MVFLFQGANYENSQIMNQGDINYSHIRACLNTVIFFRNFYFSEIQFFNENKGLNKFDSIPVETSDILQAVKNLNFANSANRKESFSEFHQKNFVTVFDEIDLFR